MRPVRARLLLVAAVAVVAALTVAGAVIAAGRAGRPAAIGAGRLAGAVMPADLAAAAIRLRDQDGRVADLRSLRGRVVVLTFLYSTCQDTCPIVAQQIRGALDQLGHDVPVLAVSVDPAQDTAAHAKAFLLRQRMTGRMRFLLGPRARLTPIWRAYGIAPQRRHLEHTIHVMLIDRRGRLRVGFPIDHLTPEGLAHDVRALEREPS